MNERVRLAELVAALSLGIDLGFGQPMEHVLRQCLIALRMAERIGLTAEQRAVVFYTALLIDVGCHTDAHEQAKWFGDDIALKATKYAGSSARTAIAAMKLLGSGMPALHRFRIGLEYAVSGRRELDEMITHHAAMARTFGEQLGLGRDVVGSLACAYEQWDGKGWPGERSGEDIPIAARIAHMAEYIEVAHRVGGVDAAIGLARRQSGKQFDPALCDLIASGATMLLSDLDGVNTWDAVIDVEPSLTVTLDDDGFDAALEAIANFIDLKSPYFLGHSRTVAGLVAQACAHLSMTEAETSATRRAALVAGFGRLGVSNAIWDKAGPLGAGEWERVRMHPYLTERMLRQSRSLSALGALAVQIRERLDGSGYPRGLNGSALSRTARVLAAADAYHAMREPRPYRPERTAGEAAKELRAEVRAGRLDAEACEAVLAAAGHRVPRRREGPAGLTAREVEVLGLLARGFPNKDIAARLVISPKTVANHVEHIYTKIGASTRAAASLFAVRHGLLSDEEFVRA